MSLIVTAIGILSKDPMASKDGSKTIWKVKPFGKEEVTLFSTDNPTEARRRYRNGSRIRGEGRANWSEFNEDWNLTLGNSAIDGSDAKDNLTIKVDGTVNHELQIEKDDDDEGGGRYIPVEIEAPVRKFKDGEWTDGIDYIKAHILGDAIDKLMELEKEGVESICFKGDVAGYVEWIKGEPGYYAEIYEVAPSQGRGVGGSDDEFWKSKPRGLANRKSAPVASTTATGKKMPPKKGGNFSDEGPNDNLPF